ncbi:uncharacterized protein [Magallana gigas]|uniref:uncharacterized protein n=1 Tax=Magallana gigas TaxID=29159 RepID=UPI00333FAB24
MSKSNEILDIQCVAAMMHQGSEDFSELSRGRQCVANALATAETKWAPLLKTLGELIENVSYTDDEILNMSWEHKSKLIKADPDFFYRIEFQQRGSPHVHMLLWIKDAPYMVTHEKKEIEDFINKYVTYDDDENFAAASVTFNDICAYLNSDAFKGSDLTFEQYLSVLNVEIETYIHAIRSSLKQDRVFLKRSPKDSRGQRGMSNLLRHACEEARRNESDIRQQVRKIGNKFLTHVEIGAQEAVYIVLQMPLRHSSRCITFINTSPPEERVVLLKPRHVLEDLKDDSTDIESGNILTLYQQRPKIIEGLCLADFVSQFSVKYKTAKTKKALDEEFLPENEYEEDISEDYHYAPLEVEELAQSYVYKNGVEVIKRKKPCVLRWVHFDKETDSEKYYREHLMLFIPWRNEEKDLIKTFASFEESFQSCRLQVEKKLKEYQKREININDVEQMLHCMDDNACSEYIAPGCEHQDEIDKEEGNTLSEKYGCFDPGKHAPEYDIGLDIGIVRKQLEEDISQLGEMDDYSYRKMVRSLNEQQKEFFNHVMHWLKTRISPLYVFLTGGAGVGKSVVTRALYQGLLKFYSHQLNESPDTFHVLLCAPTGKAAHNINGATIHSSFCIPVGQGFAYKPLDMQQLNTLRTKYMHLKVLIIDEVSMVGQNMFNFVNLRLQEIRGCPKPFGGVSVITVGDLYQLKPVMDKWIFSQFERDYGPLGANLWKDNFHMYELTKIMRQKDDKDFAELLNRLREGKHNADDINVFKMHVTEDDAELSDIPHLYTTRKEVEMYNTRVYDIAQVNMKIEIQAIDWVIGTSDSKIQSRVLDRIPVENSKTMGLSTKLKLVLNIPAEITNNVDVQDGITNGASCIVKHFDFRVEGSNRCSIIWVEFTEKEIGKAMRTKLARLFKPDISKTWTPILEITRIFKIHVNGTYQVKRKQFPLQLSTAKTIHKSQGSTLTDAVVHLGTRKNEHMHYVGFSRVTGSTADYDSTLDHIYTNILPIQINFWGTLESYYSDHKPIYVSLE